MYVSDSHCCCLVQLWQRHNGMHPRTQLILVSISQRTCSPPEKRHPNSLKASVISLYRKCEALLCPFLLSL